MTRRASTMLRKITCALLPNYFNLARRLNEDITFVGPNRPGHGGRGVFIHGIQLERELSLLPSILSVGANVLDVGASSGIYSLLAAAHVGPKGRVIAFEPNPEMVKVLRRNIDRNNLDNVEVLPLALSDSVGAGSLWHHGGLPNRYSLVALDEGRIPQRSTKTAISTIDAVTAELSLESLALLKIDVEGAEAQVLRGGQHVLRTMHPVIIVEKHKARHTLTPPDYTAVHIPDSHNLILIPTERAQSLSYPAPTPSPY